ncbi:hypothetical protein ACFWBB_31945 [Streptomyces sp. NPDC060000]|uniref:hypothetical protein n=1 Tax=Streptomyces sp. NPDC060000 TaxID=3347031 RepID=UPI0036CCD840
MRPNEIDEVLNRPIGQELPARDVTRLACVDKDGTPAQRSDRLHLQRVIHRHVHDEEGARTPVATLAHRLLKRRHQ